MTQKTILHEVSVMGQKALKPIKGKRLWPFLYSLAVLAILASTQAGYSQGRDSLSVDSQRIRELLRPKTLVVPMVLPAVPHITYSVPSTLGTGTAVNYLPTNTGGAVYADGDVSTFAGSGAAGLVNGTGTAASFRTPIGVVTDGSGNVYISDALNHCIRKITAAGVVSTFAGNGTSGTADGTGTAARFNGPNGLAIDGSGNLYVSDRSNFKVRKVTPAGVVTTLAGSGVRGYAEGTGTAAVFNALSGIVVDGSGNVFVSDEGNQRIRKITPAGVVTTFAGSGVQGNTNGTGTGAQFNYPKGMVRDASGNIYTTDYAGNNVRKISTTGVVTTLASVGYHPFYPAVDASGNIYVALEGHQIQKVTPTGTVSTYAGTGSLGNENGAPLSASFNAPAGIWVDATGAIYISDTNNNLIRRKGNGQGYSISPALPAGLTFNKTTGAISGTPTTPTSSTTYTITAYNAGGTGTATVTFAVGTVSGPSSTQNYIQTRSYLQAYSTAPTTITATTAIQQIQYVDGLGRPLQQVQVKGSPAQKDIVQTVVYDNMGRESRKYLPYTATTADGSYKSGVPDVLVKAFYNPTTPGATNIATTPYPYADTKYEASPLNRVAEQGFPGASWQLSTSGVTGAGHTQRLGYYSNSDSNAYTNPAATRKISKYGVTLDSYGVPTLTHSGSYKLNQLTIKVSMDENYTSADARAGQVWEFTDKEGRIVVKRMFTLSGTTLQMLSTYYVYDDFGHLAFVLPPGTNPDRDTGVPTATELNNFAYQYRYDGRGRVSYKKLPGESNWETFNYNQSGLLVFHQDSRQQTETIPGFTPGKYHTFYKYDGLGRVIMKGVERNVTGDREAIADILREWPFQWDNRSSATGNLHGYTNQSVPNASEYMDILEVNYYDNYDIPNLPHDASAENSKMTRGLLTATKVKVIGTTNTYLWTVNYYNDKGQLVRIYKQNYYGGVASASNYEDVLNEYNFSGLLTKSTRWLYTTQDPGFPQIMVVTEYTYDHQNRLVDTWKTVNPGQGPRTLIGRNEYNEIGQLKDKKLHSTNGTAFGQTITYGYNTRGWVNLTNSPLFRQVLRYDDSTSNKQYNGNIAYQVFSRYNNASPAVKTTDTYTYSYDKLNRLTEGALTGGKGRETLAYTNMGNISSLTRTGNSSTVVDQLAYTYTGNKLATVADANSNTTQPYQLAGTTSYTYDANGNMKTRVNSTNTGNNITAVTYNYLNLPQSVTATTGNVTYTYDGNGRKLRSVNGINGQTRDYIDGIEYAGGTMELIQTEEGRITCSGTTYTYHYFLRDHLGNNRVGFAQGTNVTTPNFTADYYPFGLQYQSDIRAGSPINNYLYNGKEYQNGLKLYDYGARLYDPVIGRWNRQDPMSESGIQISVSTYGYALNNPLSYIDLFGLLPGDVNGGSLPLVTIYSNGSFWFDMFGGYGGYGGFGSGVYPINFYLGGYSGAGGSNVNSSKTNIKLFEAAGINSDNSINKNFNIDFEENIQDDGGNKEKKSTNKNEIKAYGFGVAINAGLGLFSQGLQMSLGVFGEGPGSLNQIYFSFGVPSSPLYVDASASVQLLFGKSNSSSFDLSGQGRSFGAGVGPYSSSFSQGYGGDGTISNNIIGFGPSVGIEYTGGGTKTYTYAAPIYFPMLFTFPGLHL